MFSCSCSSSLRVPTSTEQALRCFERAALLFHNRPHLWLRMAECSITEHRLRHSRDERAGRFGGRGSGSSVPASKKQPGAGGGTRGPVGPGDAADSPAEVPGGEGQQRERRPLPWRSIGSGQHRRVLLPIGSTGGGDCARVDGVVGPGGSAIPPLDDDGAAAEANGSSANMSGVPSSSGGAGGGAGAAAGGREGDPGGVGSRGRRERGAREGCSLAHASRCLHNVMYLCAAQAQVCAEACRREGMNGV